MNTNADFCGKLFEIRSITGYELYSGKGETLNHVIVSAVLSGAVLSGADLRYADLRDADLRYAQLRGANLSGADLRYADLRYAKLRGADLRYADLRDADLRDADLRYAKLSGAVLFDKTLVGVRPILQIGPIGSRYDTLTSYITSEGVYVQTGCFFGTLSEFSEAVNKEHGDNSYAIEYKAAIALILAHSELWKDEA